MTETPIADRVGYTKQDKPLRLPEALESLGHCITALEDRLGLLINNLEPILVPPNPEAPMDPGPTASNESSLHNQVQSFEYRLNRIAYDLNRAISRIDL